MKWLLFLFPFSLLAQPAFPPAFWTPATAAATVTSYIIKEDFEEVNSGGALGSSTDGFDDPQVTEKIASSNNYTAALIGTYSLIVTNGGDVQYIPALDYTNTEVFFACKVTSDSSTVVMIQRDVGDTTRVQLNYSGGGGMRLLSGSGDSETTGHPGANNLIYCWISYNTNGNCSAEWQTTQTKVGSGNNFVSFNNGASARIRRFYLNPNVVPVVYDKLRVTTNAIGSNPQ